MRKRHIGAAGLGLALALGSAGPAFAAETVEDWPPGHARGHVYRSRRGRGARIPGRHEQVRRHGRRPRDRSGHRRYRREPRLRDTRRAQGRGAGQGRHCHRAAVGLRGHRDQGLRQDPAAGDVHQRHLRRPGDDLRRPGAELLPLQHGRRAVVGRYRRVHLQREGLPDDRHHRRGLLVHLHPGVRAGARVLRPRRGGDRASLGPARHQGLRLDHRGAARGRRRDLPRTRRRRRGELPQPVPPGRRRRGPGRRYHHGRSERAFVEGFGQEGTHRYAGVRAAGR